MFAHHQPPCADVKDAVMEPRHAATLLALAALAVATAPLLCAATPARVESTFDYAWRFHSHDDPAAVACYVDSAANWATNLTGSTCTGLTYIAQGRIDAPGCMKSCCANPECLAWQWKIEQWRNGTGGCYQNLEGVPFQCKVDPASTWVGGSRKAAPPMPAYSFAEQGFDDSAWEVVDAPHDFVALGDFDEAAQPNFGYLFRNVSWYRKHFTLPAAWGSDGGSTFFYTDGAFHRTEWFLNGKFVGVFTSGYVPFMLDLSEANFGPGATNVLAVRADASYGSGHWYEGGGLYRPTRIVHVPAVHVAPNGLAAAAVASTSEDGPATSTTCQFSASVEVFNNGTSDAGTVSAHFDIIDASGASVASSDASVASIQAGGAAVISAKPIDIPNPHLWSVQDAYLYTIAVTLSRGSSAIDTVNASAGCAAREWSPTDGFSLNGEHVEFRGFSNHNSFGGVGVAVAPRIDLFKVQGYRGMGANVQRMSHNPPVGGLLDITDRLGVMVWDEARDFGPQQRFVDDMAAMVKRDRNHPSVALWSYCNEIECHEATNYTGFAFRAAALAMDSTRPLTANTVGTGIPSEEILISALDVLGLSHRPLTDFQFFHNSSQYSKYPLVASESSSCMTQRGKNAVNPAAGVFFSSFDGPCLQQCLSKSYDIGYIAGTLGVWTATDYIGEPGRYKNLAWPHASSSFGQVDLAGFNKPHSAWYRSWWLASVPTEDAGRPPIPAGPSHVAAIAEVWDASLPATGAVIHVFSSAATVELLLNGKTIGASTPVSMFGWAEWDDISYAAGNLTAVARDSSGGIVATHTRITPGAPAALVLSVDAPNEDTGTGSALVLDGHDAALIRATVVDASGHPVLSAAGDAVNITFTITSGPGFVAGTANGDPADHTHVFSTWRHASAGLARAVVKVNVDGTSEAARLGMEGPIDADAERIRRGVSSALLRARANARRVAVMDVDHAVAAAAPIVVSASAPGLTGGSVSVAVSSDVDADGVLAVAARSLDKCVLQVE